MYIALTVSLLILQHGCIALHHAAMTGHTDIVEALLKGGSMIDAQDKVSESHLVITF